MLLRGFERGTLRRAQADGAGVTSASHRAGETPTRQPAGRRRYDKLAGQFAQEFALVHVVFEGFVAVDEDDGTSSVKRRRSSSSLSTSISRQVKPPRRCNLVSVSLTISHK